MLVVHYHKETGRISAWGSADSDHSHLVDHEIVRFETDVAIDPKRQKIANGALVEIAPDELKLWNLPTDGEVAARIANELTATDQYMMPDREVRDREAWVTYRKKLRDLSITSEIAMQLENWPERPDGKDSRP